MDVLPVKRISAVTKKILSDLEKLKDPIYKRCFEAEFDQDPQRVKCTMRGQPGTLYQGLVLKLTLIFPDNYPFKPPAIIFSHSLFHPNVTAEGVLDPTIFQDWCPAYTIPSILMQVLVVLGDPQFCLEENLVTKVLERKCVNSFAEEIWDDKIMSRQLILASLDLGEPRMESEKAMVEELSVAEIEKLFASLNQDQ